MNDQHNLHQSNDHDHNQYGDCHDHHHHRKIHCFAVGTKLQSINGTEIAVESLKPGDELICSDRGDQNKTNVRKVRWIGFQRVSKFADHLDSAPIKIRQGALDLYGALKCHILSSDIYQPSVY